jgi:chorismate-pyruvate lyase
VPGSTLLRLLLCQDGSTTRLLETLTGAQITVHVIEQGFVDTLPVQLAGVLPGKTFLRRLTSLEADGRVLLDSISYIAVEVLPRSVVQELVAGIRPIGHLLARSWTRRVFRNEDTPLLEELWDAIGTPDPQASRSTLIVTPEGPCMVLGETFRQGVLAHGTAAA